MAVATKCQRCSTGSILAGVCVNCGHEPEVMRHRARTIEALKHARAKAQRDLEEIEVELAVYKLALHALERGEAPE